MRLRACVKLLESPRVFQLYSQAADRKRTEDTEELRVGFFYCTYFLRVLPLLSFLSPINTVLTNLTADLFQTHPVRFSAQHRGYSGFFLGAQSLNYAFTTYSSLFPDADQVRISVGPGLYNDSLLSINNATVEIFAPFSNVVIDCQSQEYVFSLLDAWVRFVNLTLTHCCP